MHGELRRPVPRLRRRVAGGPPLSTGRRARAAGRGLRPDVVWFGEMPYQMDPSRRAVQADLFVSIGTSGAVYPAAGFVQARPRHGARTLELNLEPSEGTRWFDETRHGPAGPLVPAWVDDVLQERGLSIPARASRRPGRSVHERDGTHRRTVGVDRQREEADPNARCR